MELTVAATQLLHRYARRRITRAEVAKRLGVTERQVTRYMRELGLARDPSASFIERQTAAKHKLVRITAARLVAEGKLSIADAARRAGCSQRTIYRYLKR